MTDAIVDITGAVNAYASSGYQRIRIPTHCFTEQGIDFSQTLMPLAISTDTNMSFDIGNVMLIPAAKQDSNQLACHVESEIVNGVRSEIYRRYQGNNGYVQSGWGRNFSHTAPASAHFPQSGGIGARYNEAAPGETGGLVLNIVEGQTKRDISRFMESGTLSFDLTVTSFASHSGDIEVHMGPASGSESNVFRVTDLKENTSTSVSIPLKHLFSSGQNTLDINTIQSIDRPVIIQPAAIGENETLQGFEFIIDKVYLDMIPPAGGCLPNS